MMSGELLAGVIRRLPKNSDGSVNYEDICSVFNEPCEKGSVTVSFVPGDSFPVPEEKQCKEAFYGY